jgi:hypothetical protein
MSDTPARGRLCEIALRSLDATAENRPPAGSDPEILRHLAECPDCCGELEIRTRIADQLKRAVQSEVEDPYLATRIRRRLQQYEARDKERWRWGRQLVAVTAVLVICLGGWTAYQLGHLRITSGAQEAYISSISRKVAGILRVGLGDHVHCTVFRKLPKKPPPAAELVAQLGPEYSGLYSIVRARTPEEYRVVMAHRCSYHGRKFTHLALQGDSELLSLVITRKGQGESFGRDQLAPALSESGIPIYEGGVQRFAIAGFESHDHLVYLVSDLDEQQNLNLLASLAPPVHAFLGKLEG